MSTHNYLDKTGLGQVWEKIKNITLTKTNTTSYTPTADYHPATKKYVDDAVLNASGIPDWDENDTTSSSYVQNRTHYTEDPVIIENVLTFNSDIDGTNYNIPIAETDWFQQLDNGCGYILTLNETTYTGTFIPDGPGYIAGNPSLLSPTLEDTEESFALGINVENAIAFLVTEEPNTSISLSLSIAVETVHTLDDKYLNGSLIASGTGRQSEIFNGMNTGKIASGDYSHIEGFGTIRFSQLRLSGEAGSVEYEITNASSLSFNELIYLTRYATGQEIFFGTDNMISTGSKIVEVTDGFLVLDKTLDPNSAITSDLMYWIANPSSLAAGTGSHVEGYSCFSINDASHAEGYYTTASGEYSHAEGFRTTALGDGASHAEGYQTNASGNYSHSEGFSTTASGSYSHAEGSETTASGNYSHAEGFRTTASGSVSHAEGYKTTAQRRSQHVFGEYNVLDTGGSGVSVKGTYIEIVGKGTSDSARSNARTLDWSGNEVLAGKLTVGAAPTADMDVATKKYVDDNAGGSYTLALSGNVIQLKDGNTVASSITLPIYDGGVS